MGSIPLIYRRAEALAHHEAGGLSHQGHGHLPIADIQIHGPCALPTQGLIVFEELFNVPSLGIMTGKVLQFIPITGAEKGFKVVISLLFPFPLNKLVIGALQAPGQRVGLLGRSIAGPMPLKSLGWQPPNRSDHRRVVGHGS